MREAPKEFVVILDNEGIAVDLCPMHDDIIWSIVRVKDKEDPESAPHVPWAWSGSSWSPW